MRGSEYGGQGYWGRSARRSGVYSHTMAASWLGFRACEWYISGWAVWLAWIY